MKVITGIQNAVADCQTHKAVHDKYLKIGWKITTGSVCGKPQGRAGQLLTRHTATLKKHGRGFECRLWKPCKRSTSDLQATYAELMPRQLAAANEELQPMKDIRYWVGKVLIAGAGQPREEARAEAFSSGEDEAYCTSRSSKQQEQNPPQQKKQDMEL